MSFRTPMALMLLAVLSACTVSMKVDIDSSADAALLGKLQEGMANGSRVEGVLFFSQEERRVAFRNIDKLMPVRTVHAADKPLALPRSLRDLNDLTYEVNGEIYTLSSFLARPEQIGFLVVQNGNILLEHYAPGISDEDVWVSFSVTKSVTSMLIGAAIHDGYIRSVDEPVVDYLPRLRGTGYEHTSIRNVLNMASGVRWNEDYEDRQSDVARAGGANGVSLVSYLAKLPTEHEPGVKFNYNTGETNLAGEILRAAIGNNASEYLQSRIWRPFGMESDANWLLGEPGGGETGGCCISATLRDYARIGMFALSGGVLPDGTRVLPEDWMADSVTPSAGYEGYGYLWWLLGEGSYSALGIFGQQIFIDPESGLVIAAHSNAQRASGSPYHYHLRAATLAIRDYLRGDRM
ncbi:MAG: beta-lactamase family protein [Pseudomonadales bacterium]|nr:beta-lactamase family protein [Pseudomonadales bacterium]